MNKFKFSCIVCLAYVIFEVRYAILGYFMHLTPNTIMQKRKRKCNAREGGQNMVVGYKGKWLYKRRACRLTPIIIGAWVRNDACMLYLFCVFERVYLKRILFFFSKPYTHSKFQGGAFCIAFQEMNLLLSTRLLQPKEAYQKIPTFEILTKFGFAAIG